MDVSGFRWDGEDEFIRELQIRIRMIFPHPYDVFTATGVRSAALNYVLDMENPSFASCTRSLRSIAEPDPISDETWVEIEDLFNTAFVAWRNPEPFPVLDSGSSLMAMVVAQGMDAAYHWFPNLNSEELWHIGAEVTGHALGDRDDSSMDHYSRLHDIDLLALSAEIVRVWGARAPEGHERFHIIRPEHIAPNENESNSDVVGRWTLFIDDLIDLVEPCQISHAWTVRAVTAIAYHAVGPGIPHLDQHRQILRFSEFVGFARAARRSWRSGAAMEDCFSSEASRPQKTQRSISLGAWIKAGLLDCLEHTPSDAFEFRYLAEKIEDFINNEEGLAHFADINSLDRRGMAMAFRRAWNKNEPLRLIPTMLNDPFVFEHVQAIREHAQVNNRSVPIVVSQWTVPASKDVSIVLRFSLTLVVHSISHAREVSSNDNWAWKIIAGPNSSKGWHGPFSDPISAFSAATRVVHRLANRSVKSRKARRVVRL